MSERLEVSFTSLNNDLEQTSIVLAGEGLDLGSKARELDTKSASALTKAAAAADFKGKAKSSIEILAPAKLGIDRLIMVGKGKSGSHTETSWMELGGTILALADGKKGSAVSLVIDIDAEGDMKPDQIAAAIAQGAMLRHYSFKKYLTKNGDDGADKKALKKLVIHTPNPDKAKTAFAPRKAIVNGVYFARDLVNEPANVLGPVELAERTKALESVGVEVEIFDVAQLTDLKMHTLLAVGQGSARPSRVAVMQWNGAKSKKSKPVAFVGKGVIFDTGGISIKPAAGMEDMKGDMGGAAAVIGVMHALAERNAAVNAVGLIGCVENMVSGKATRPGDIVTSMSGQTVEILNTDAEGRLVLADVLWYAQERFKPRLIIDLATLTGAIMVALGKEYAGLFSNDDKLAADLLAASSATGEKIWRMPLDKGYDKLIESKNADVKNIGGRWAGACTAAAFLQKFIKDTPWAHLDVAGTAMDAPRSEISASWASGWGVRLLDRFVADNYEKSDKDK